MIRVRSYTAGIYSHQPRLPADAAAMGMVADLTPGEATMTAGFYDGDVNF